MKVKWGNNSKFVLGSYGSCAMHSIIFQQSCISNVQAVDDKVSFQTSRKCYENFNQREITQRQYEVQLRYFHPAFCITATNTNAKFHVDQTGDDKVMLRTILQNFLMQG